MKASLFEELTAVPDFHIIEHIPSSKLPATFNGTDMRTLRKQMEVLNVEISECLGILRYIFDQSNALREYTDLLLHQNIKNGQTMNDEMTAIDIELQEMECRRVDFEDRLKMALLSEKTLQSLAAEIDGCKSDLQDAEEMHQEAEEILKRALAETAALDSALRSSVAELQQLHSELEGWKVWSWLRASEDKADTFWLTSKHGLRRGFRRFHTAVSSRRRVTSACRVLGVFYRRWLTHIVLLSWKIHTDRQSIVRGRNKKGQQRTATGISSLHPSRGERLSLCFACWKVFAALRQRYRAAARRRILFLGFFGWRQSALYQRDQRLRILTADSFAMQTRDRRLLARVWRGWKGGTHFLEWDTDVLREQWTEAEAHHSRRLLAHWLRAAQHGKKKLLQSVTGISVLRLTTVLSSWNRLFRCRAFRRVAEYRRLLRRLAQSVDRGRRGRYRLAVCVSGLVDAESRAVRTAVGRWLGFGGRMRQARLSVSRAVQAHALRIVSLDLRTCLGYWNDVTRQRVTRKWLLYDVSVGHHRVRLQTTFITRLNARWGSKILRQQQSWRAGGRTFEYSSLRKCLHVWLRRRCDIRKAAPYSGCLSEFRYREVAMLHHRAIRRRHKLLLLRWVAVTKSKIRLHALHVTVIKLTEDRTSKEAFGVWRLLFIRRLRQRILASESDLHAKALQHASTLEDIAEKQRQLTELSTEETRLVAVHRGLEEAATRATGWLASLGGSEAQLTQQLAVLRTKENEQLAYLEAAKSERTRAAALEQAWREAARERREQAELAVAAEAKRRRELEPYLRELHDLQTAVAEAERQAEAEANDESQALLRQQEQLHLLEQSTRDRQEELSRLEDQRAEAQWRMSQMQRAVKSAAAEAELLSRQLQTELRHRRGQARVMTEEVRIAEARVTGLRAVLQDRNRNRLAREFRDVAEREAR